MKTEVYSWRVESELKAELELVAQGRKLSVACALKEAVRQWIGEQNGAGGDSEQERLRAAAMRSVGSYRGPVWASSENTSQAVKEILRRKHAKTQRAN